MGNLWYVPGAFFEAKGWGREGLHPYQRRGVWQATNTVKCGVENPIKNLVKTMDDSRLGRTSVSLQFIRFGEDGLGKERLRYLDNEPVGDLGVL